MEISLTIRDIALLRSGTPVVYGAPLLVALTPADRGVRVPEWARHLPVTSADLDKLAAGRSVQLTGEFTAVAK